MPYIRPSERTRIDRQIDCIAQIEVMTAGEVNYLISSLVAAWVDGMGKPSYETLRQGHSVLQDATAEYYRRVMAPYEDEKRKANGDVYGRLTEGTDT